MVFATFVQQSGIDHAELCRELQIDALLLDQWLSGLAVPPKHIVRALSMVAFFSKPSNPVNAPTESLPSRSVHYLTPTLISLFSGAGGLDIGLEAAGFRTVLANEIESHACESLRANKMLSRFTSSEFERWFDTQVLEQRCYRSTNAAEMDALRARLRPSLIASQHPLADAAIMERDVRELSAATVTEVTGMEPGSIDLIAGGAPCQPFSRAGKQESVDCADGRLFLEFVRLVDHLRPRWFLFENVKGLVQHRTEALYATCSCCAANRPVSFVLRDQPISSDQVIDRCALCGQTNAMVARWEKRRGGSLDMIEAEFSRLGYRCSSRVLNARDFGAPQDRDRLFIIGSRDGERFDWPKQTHGPAQAPRSLFDRHTLTPYVSVREALYEAGHWFYGALGDEAVLWVKNVVRPHDEPVTWSLDRVAPTIGAHQAAKLAIAPNGVPAEQLARQQWHTLGRRQGDTAPVPVEHKYLSDQEILILQTFPRHWYLHGTRMERAFQIGNAVPPVLAAAVGGSLMRAIAGETVSPPNQATSA